MESDDVMSKVKIEIDIPEELPSLTRTADHHPQTSDQLNSDQGLQQTGQASEPLSVVVKTEKMEDDCESSNVLIDSEKVSLVDSDKERQRQTREPQNVSNLHTGKTSEPHSGVVVKIEPADETFESNNARDLADSDKERQRQTREPQNASNLHTGKTAEPHPVVVKIEPADETFESNNPRDLADSDKERWSSDCDAMQAGDEHPDDTASSGSDTDDNFLQVKFENEAEHSGTSSHADLTGSIHADNKKRPFRCGVCEASFAQSGHLTTHMLKHTGARPHACTQCNKTFKRGCDLTEHMLKHTGARPHTCTQCDKTFKRPYDLTIHMRKHTGEERPHACTQCDRAFERPSSLATHMRRHTGERPFSCSVCKATFIESGDLTRHMRRHTGERPFKCKECGASFPRSVELTTHMRKHTGERPYACTQCEKTFAVLHCLTIHMRSHSGEKPFPCTVCNAKFSRSCNLTRHMLTHTGDRPYKCHLCKKSFKQSNNLNYHLQTHAKKASLLRSKPSGSNDTDGKNDLLENFSLDQTPEFNKDGEVACPLCTVTFKWAKSLKRHMKRHSGERPFTCSVCEAAFVTSYDLTRHMQIHTRDTLPVKSK